VDAFAQIRTRLSPHQWVGIGSVTIVTRLSLKFLPLLSCPLKSTAQLLVASKQTRQERGELWLASIAHHHACEHPIERGRCETLTC
jgi:hypothetical protein